MLGLSNKLPGRALRDNRVNISNGLDSRLKPPSVDVHLVLPVLNNQREREP